MIIYRRLFHHALPFLISFCTISFSALSQDAIPKSSLMHHFSVSYHTGWNAIEFQSTVSNLALRPTIGRNRALRAAYRLNFNQKGYTELGAGFGFQTERSQIPVSGFDQFGNGVESTDRFVFSRWDFTTAYQVFAINQNTFHVLGGAGLHFFAPVGSGLSYQSEDEYFNIQYHVKPQATPFVNLGTSYQFETKRQDLLGLKLYYNYGWKSFFDGSYTFESNDAFSSGRIVSQLKGVHLGLEYTFTRDKKRSQINMLQTTSNLDRKSARKKHKFEKRAIDPKHRMIALGLGIGVTVNKFTPSNDPFYNPNFGGFLAKISYEQGWQNNLFFEADYHGFHLYEAAGIQSSQGDISFNSAWGSAIAFGHFISGGAHYKVQRKKTNFQWFNVHAGLGLGVQFYPKGDFGGGTGGSSVDNQELYSYTSTTEVTGNLMPIFYTGISKDIRITQMLSFSLAYRYQFGMNTVLQTDYLVAINGAAATRVVGEIDGTAALFTFGLKYRLK